MAHLNRLLSFNAGYVDTASFLAIHGLFAAHVTGNFVTLGAALVSNNHAGAWAKLSALPMFCITILLVKLLDQFFIKRAKTSYPTLLKMMFLFFILAAVISVFYLPFPFTDTWSSFAVGMLLVAAMAIQNAIHRLHWVKESPTTVMTGSTTQLMLDVGELFSQSNPEKRQIIQQRFKSIFPTMLSFALGCAVAAIVFKFALLWLFIVPPVLMALIYWKKENYKKA
ncbi:MULTISPECIES: YoaK family protein [Acinetobacter]|uniref:DUF1275 domain-containing protein n=1 Tax=Acinetobacter wuhouensis TaxID=1879050 RepID=A0A3G2T3F1_9GAMM|nr:MULTISPECIES: YoaK family protein [Acinetobacter]AYO54728.1 DUF1275 domain-containing protein [Acinetobacter wuhouensis]RZG46116.1 DUF1275 domain-containing protein [Acinetobacter wuhouensis]RZG71491.1 DUF1275 domain-containing protein [Acinetobacter wuhouensis]RZG76140.1 DUF1275 domain-containing protein [Acinetobacter sp. WCHAc060025]